MKIPQKRYEKALGQELPPAEEEASFIVLKDITVNPAVLATNLRHEKTPEDTAAPEIEKSQVPAAEQGNLPQLNKMIKIRMKRRIGKK